MLRNTSHALPPNGTVTLPLLRVLNMSKPLASLSLDLDNKWSYLKTHGDAGWEKYPSYFDLVCPRIVEFFAARRQRITFFVVGQDATFPKNREALQLLVDSGHEIANHSFHHEPWLHLYSEVEVTDELARAEAAIGHATGVKTLGFRGPGFSVSPTVLKVLDKMEYVYDASTFPTFLGPVARAYYLMTAGNLTRDDVQQRKKLFGTFWDGFRSLRPHRLPGKETQIVEIPVSTMPVFKIPIHLSYIMFLAGFSRRLARHYFQSAMYLCKVMRIQPSLLLHPLDFLGANDDAELRFFPGMNLPSQVKREVVTEVIDDYRKAFQVVTMLDHAKSVGCRTIDARAADFATSDLATVGA